MIKKTNKSLDGTSFHGATFSASLADLQVILGAPNSGGDQHDKVQNEWELELEDGTIFSVYDWKSIVVTQIKKQSNGISVVWIKKIHSSLKTL